jgi:hypothetical protein
MNADVDVRSPSMEDQAPAPVLGAERDLREVGELGIGVAEVARVGDAIRITRRERAGEQES